MLTHIAWRNLWRVPRRTVIILISVIVGVWAMVFMRALMAGMLDQMVENGIKTLTGHVQIHRQGYFNDPVVDYSITEPEAVLEALDALPEGVRWARRVRVPGVVSNARNSAGITIVGIVPEEEAAVSFIGPGAVIRGRYLQEEDQYGIVVGRGLAEEFDTEPGKKLVLTSQGMEGDIASGGFRITGIYRSELEQTEERFAFVLLGSAQEMLGMGKALSEIALLAPHHGQAQTLEQFLKARLDERYEVLSWRELLPVITSTLKIWDGFTYIWYAIIFIAMAFGLVNTMLIAVFERFREFGVLKAIGMKPRWIVMQILAEAFWLLVVGIALGDLLSLATISWLAHVGIDLSAFAQGVEELGFSRIIYPAFNMKDMLMANVFAMTLGLAVNLYPALKACRITPVAAMARA